MSHPTVLLVDEDPVLLEVLGAELGRRGYEVVGLPDGNAAAALVLAELPDVAVLDMLLPGQSGFQVTRLLKERSDGRVPVLMTSGNTSPAHRDYAFASGVDRFLLKPFPLDELLEVVEELCPAVPAARIVGPGAGRWRAAMSA